MNKNAILSGLSVLAFMLLSCNGGHKEEVVAEVKDSVKIKEVTPGSKPAPDEVIAMLKEGNARFVSGKSVFPHTDSLRIKLANDKSQGDYAYASILSCSDSRVPVEMIFDAGIMDLFIIRIAGNVCDVDEIGSIEYGINHVKTPVLVILGHTKCGAVTAVTKELKGEGHELERNIPPLVDNIIPAAKKMIDANKKAGIEELVPLVIEENIWQNMENLFLKSPSVRHLALEGKIKVVGAVYDLTDGTITWLDDTKAAEVLKKAEASKTKETEPMAVKKGAKNKTSHH